MATLICPRGMSGLQAGRAPCSNRFLRALRIATMTEGMVPMNEPGTGGAASLLQGKRIAIAGAGPCGLTLARLLQQKGADVRVFELESSTAARNQGGSLDLHEDSGQLALRKAGLHELFLA